jgi:hypothetical protein
MIKKTGKQMFSHLVNSAKVAHLSKHNMTTKRKIKKSNLKKIKSSRNSFESQQAMSYHNTPPML